jgi:ABC-type branched-subunit amino acid transport system substrate-binding protein
MPDLRRRRIAQGTLGATLVALAPRRAQAQDGIAADSVHVGRSAGVTGSLAARMKPATEAMTAYLDSVNAAGGVAGRRIRLTTLDDANDPKRAADNTRRLIDDERVFAMFANSGTAQTQAALEVMLPRGVPLIGTSSGADSIQKPHPLVFHYKASYGRELERIAAHLEIQGTARVALVHSPDSTGQEGMASAKAALAARRIEAVAVATTKPEDVAAFLPRLAETRAQALILTALAAPGASFYAALARLAQRPQVFTWSIAGVEAIFKEVGERIRGLVVSQVFPSPQSTRSRLAVDYQALLKQAGLDDGGYPGLEGYVAARILVLGLQRTGRELTRERLAAALRSLRGIDLGGELLDFGNPRQVGRNFVELTMVGADGRFIR